MIFPHWLSRLERYKAQKPMLANSATSNSASEIRSDEHDRISASVSRRARRRLRDRPRRLRDGTRGAGDLALRVVAFNRGAVGPDLFDRRADLNAAFVLAVLRLQAGFAVFDCLAPSLAPGDDTRTS